MAVVNRSGSATVGAVSCWAPGDCALGGSSNVTTSSSLAYVDTQLDGVMGTALFVPGLSARTGEQGEDVLAVSCAPSGECAAGGYYRANRNPIVGFVDTGLDGAWRPVQDVLGPELRAGRSFAVTALSCPATGSCAAGGTFRVAHGGWRTYVADEVDGTWGDGVAIPTPPTPGDAQDAWIGSVACSESLACAAAGYFQPGRDTFVATAAVFTPPGPSITALTPATARPHGGGVVLIRGLNLSGVSAVRFGPWPARSFVVVNLQLIRAVAPQGHGAISVVVTNLLGASGGSPATVFAYQVAPRIIGLSPDHGLVRGGTVVNVHGHDLVGTVMVLFGHRRVLRVIVRNPDDVRVIAPPGRGAVRVSLVTPEGRSPLNGLRFHYGGHRREDVARR